MTSCNTEKCWFGLFYSPTLFLSSQKLHKVNLKSDLTQTFPDTYSNWQYDIFIWVKHLHRLMKRQRKVFLKSQLFYIVWQILHFNPRNSFWRTFQRQAYFYHIILQLRELSKPFKYLSLFTRVFWYLNLLLKKSNAQCLWYTKATLSAIEKFYFWLGKQTLFILQIWIGWIEW